MDNLSKPYETLWASSSQTKKTNKITISFLTEPTTLKPNQRRLCLSKLSRAKKNKSKQQGTRMPPTKLRSAHKKSRCIDFCLSKQARFKN